MRLARLLEAVVVRGVTLMAVGLDALRNRTRKQLLATAKELELRGVSGLSKARLAQRVLEALQARGASRTPATAPASTPAAMPVAAAAPPSAVPVVAAAPPAAAATPTPDQDPASTMKLHLGPGRRGEKPVEHIPWSYGVDRVTAAAIDPEKLYAYWEVTDQAIEVARVRLKAGGPAAWLNLRVYDTTGLIFDGTNAHSYFDHRVERSDRQWFFHIGKPTSAAFVDIGLKSAEGYFTKIARSGRVDFPREGPAPWTEAEWMTVAVGGQVAAGQGSAGSPQAVGGPAGGHFPRGAPGSAAAAGPPPGAGPGDAPPAPFTPIPLWVLRQTATGHEAWFREASWEGGTRIEWSEHSGEGWFEIEGAFEWQGPVTVTSWEAGPFSYPVEVQEPRREQWQGKSFGYQVGGVTLVVDGPWEVVIRNLGAHLGRTVVARWEVYRSWVAAGGREVRGAVADELAPVRPGASELARPGASERTWMGASEVRLGGTSELWRVGASELRLGGASERLMAGSSAWMHRGASERVSGGASELRLGGASERTLAGASERMLGGASERTLGGASERALGGASERLGASERHLGASEHRLQPSPAPSPSPYPQPAGSADLEAEK